MSEIVKVIYEGRNKRGFATGKQEAVFFLPGMNEIPKDQWDKLVGDKSAGGVQHFLHTRQMHLAEESVQQSDDVGTMTIDGALQMVENAMTETQLQQIAAQEHLRKRGGRKGVLAAIEARQKMFDKVNADADGGGGGDDDGKGDED